MSYSECEQSDSKSRPFICPCGKNYLSYPALFTHIKQKHNGIAPGEVVRPRSVNKRGRPRKQMSDLPNDFLPPLQDYKNSVNRPLLKYNQVQSPHSGSDDEPNRRQNSKHNYGFITPIPTSHLTIIKNYQSTSQKYIKKPQSLPNKQVCMPPYLLQKLKAIFSPLSTGSFMGTASLEALLKSNNLYHQSKVNQRNSTRHQLGNGKYVMKLSSAIILFLQVSEDELSKRQFKNLQLLMSLLIAFNFEMAQNDKNITTQNYIKYINNFSKDLLQEVQQQIYYKNVFSLEKDAALRLLEVFNLWLIEYKLSQHELLINPNFKVQEKPKVSQQNPAYANQNYSQELAQVGTNQM